MVFHSFVIWASLYGKAVPGAYITVNMFFVLSGFLITSLLLQEWAKHDRISFGSFYVRRVLRLIPALVFVLLCQLVFLLVTGRALRAQLQMMAWIIGYSSNWAQWSHQVTDPTALLTWGHTWTLAVEEQFYIVWPLAMTVLLSLRLRARTVLAILMTGVVASTVARMWVVSHIARPVGPHAGLALASTLERLVAVRTDLRADTLLLGAAAAVLLHTGWRPSRGMRWVGTAALAVLVWVSLFAQPDARWMYGWGFTLVDAGGAALCIAVLDRRWKPTRVFAFRVPVWLGRLSYALYLWHPPVFLAVVLEAPHLSVGTQLVLAWVIVFVGACASYYVVELPFLRLKERWSKRASGAPAPEPLTSVSA